MRKIIKDFTRGLWEQIPPFRLVLGLCPTLAVTKSVGSAIGMGIATTFVLVCSNVIISSLRKSIHPKVRIAVFIVIIASFVVIVEMITQAFFYPLYQTLGIFIPLIVVNCIILGRAESFAYKNSMLRAFADGLGMGIGFTLSLTAIGAVRELIGTGKIAGKIIFEEEFAICELIGLAPGAFITIGCFLAIINFIDRRKRVC